MGRDKSKLKHQYSTNLYGVFKQLGKLLIGSYVLITQCFSLNCCYHLIKTNSRNKVYHWYTVEQHNSPFYSCVLSCQAFEQE